MEELRLFYESDGSTLVCFHCGFCGRAIVQTQRNFIIETMQNIQK